MKDREQMALLFQVVAAIQKLDTTQFITRARVGFTDAQLEHAKEVRDFVNQRAREMVEEMKKEP